MTLTKALSLRLEELLQERKITQYRLSLLSGVSQSTIGDIMHQRNKSVNIRIIYDIAQGLKMDLPEFFNSPLFKGDNITDWKARSIIFLLFLFAVAFIIAQIYGYMQPYNHRNK